MWIFSDRGICVNTDNLTGLSCFSRDVNVWGPGDEDPMVISHNPADYDRICEAIKNNDSYIIVD